MPEEKRTLKFDHRPKEVRKLSPLKNEDIERRQPFSFENPHFDTDRKADLDLNAIIDMAIPSVMSDSEHSSKTQHKHKHHSGFKNEYFTTLQPIT
jgi:hypothetical protein